MPAIASTQRSLHTVSWRAADHPIPRLSCVLAVFGVTVAFCAGAFACLTSPFWLSFAGRPAGLPPADLFFAAGTALLFAAPWAVRAALTLSKQLLRPSLARADRQHVWRPDLAQEQIPGDSGARLCLIEDFAATLCRIERHLLQGAQDRLVTMAMRVSVIREQLASATGPGADAARELLDTVHRDATQVIAELRDLGRGIRPPALDGGLGPAIESLAAHSPVPIDLRVDMMDRPSASIETVAYFCATELLAHIRELGEASYACIEIAQRDQSLLLLVTYDAAGGATAELSKGLAGAANYVRSVDGTLSVHSPEDGRTLVTAVLPLRV
jgi:hypothetical protein